MQQLDQFWADSPWERRPHVPDRIEEHVPTDLQFQRTAHDPNLGKPTSDLMRLSPSFYQRFGATDISLGAHLDSRLTGMWEYLDDHSPYRVPAALADIWGCMQERLDAAEVILCESI